LLAAAAVADAVRKAALMKGVEGVQNRSPLTVASSVMNYMTPSSFLSQAATKSLMGGGKDKKRDQVTLADAGFEGIGSAYERVSDKAAMVGAQNADDKTTLGDILDWLEKQTAKIF
jgi:GTP cyclohydrolase III